MLWITLRNKLVCALFCYRWLTSGSWSPSPGGRIGPGRWEEGGDPGPRLLGVEPADAKGSSPPYHIVDGYCPLHRCGVVDLRPDVGASGMHLLQGVGEAGCVPEQPVGLATVELHKMPRGSALEKGPESTCVRKGGAGEGFDVRPQLPRAQIARKRTEGVERDEAVCRQLTAADGDHTGPADQDYVLARCFVEQSVAGGRSEEHTSELQVRPYSVCRLLLEKKK